MTQVTSTAIHLYLRGIGDVIKQYPDTRPNWWKRVTPNVKSIDELYDEWALLGGLGTATRMQESGGIPFDNMTTPYKETLYLDIYSIGFEVSDQALEKKGGAVLRKPSEAMGFSLYDAWETSVADIVNNSQSSSYVGIDDVALLSTAHPTSSGTNWSNLSTAATLSIDALETMLQDAMNQKTYRDQNRAAMGPFNLVVPRQLAMLGKRLLKGTEQPQTTDREQNVAREDIVGVYANPYLSSATRYIMIPANAADNPIEVLTFGPTRNKYSYDGRKPANLFTATREWATRWREPAGIQGNAGA